jgi:hypothetical protein
MHTEIKPLVINGVNGTYGRYRGSAKWKARTPACIPHQHWTSQERPAPTEYSASALMRVLVRFYDNCQNGHNTFSITASIWRPGYRDGEAGGCLHNEIAAAFPELAPLIKWHGVSVDSPMHYVENTLYWLGYRGFCGRDQYGPPNLSFARNTACWQDMPENFICPEELREVAPKELFHPQKKMYEQAVIDALHDRLGPMIDEFKQDILRIGFLWEAPANTDTDTAPALTLTTSDRYVSIPQHIRP